ncbi:hypothetical protein ABZ471_32185, partial [Streptomyces sp. NPDC005728]
MSWSTTSTRRPTRSCYRFLYLIKARLRSAPPGALPAPLRATLLPPARSARAAPTRAHRWILQFQSLYRINALCLWCSLAWVAT